MLKILLLLHLIPVNIFPLSLYSEMKDCGMIIYKYRTFNNLSKQFEVDMHEPDLKIWYSGNRVIEEGLNLDIISDIYHNEKSLKLSINHYTYIDLQKKFFYVYKTFSDTASILKKYTQPDSVTVPGGWNFYAYHKMIWKENLQSLPDTLLNGIICKRLKGMTTTSRNGDSYQIIQLAYLRCDKKNSIFHMDKSFDKKMGCPLVRIDNIVPAKSFYSVQEIEFRPGKLTSEELKVFDAWEKNEKKNPVR